jgi:diguanylate cyclase (GGDEF)-like protein
MFLTRRYEKENGARIFFSIEMFLYPILLGAGLQFMFYGLSLAWLSSAVGLTGLYMMQQNEVAYIDSTVDTYNREYMNHILSSWIIRGSSFAGVMLDIDRFKSINDRFGHSEGDRALKNVTNILKDSRKDNEWVFRFAGDEFVILKLTDSRDGLVPYMEEVNRRLEEYNHADHPYELALSYGMSFFDTGNVDTFMKEMDDRMYDLKVRHHKMDDLEAGRHEIDNGQAGHHEMTGNCDNKMCVKRG